MSGGKLVQGVYAAAATPRHEDGTLDEAAFRGQLEFLMQRGIQGFAINGATGEFCLTTPEELQPHRRGHGTGHRGARRFRMRRGRRRPARLPR